MIDPQAGWVEVVEINPPVLPDMSHQQLDGAWDRVLVTDNVFGKIRVSPYSYAARITHDVPSVNPTVVVSTRDRNIRAIESEVRGALGNGVCSFLVVTGDTVPAVDHMANQFEILEHMVDLKQILGPCTVGMPTPFGAEAFRRRVDAGAEYLVAGPIIDPDTIDEKVELLKRGPADPPVILMVIPPFSAGWVNRMEQIGTVAATPELKELLTTLEPAERRSFAWDQAVAVADRARVAGCGGVVLMGLKRETVVGEAAREWRARR